MDLPLLLTFDIFGTVLDWRTGMMVDCAAAGHPLDAASFERVVDAQARLEQGSFLTYTEITRRSLVEELGMPVERASRIASSVGCWPLYPDARDAMRRLMAIAPCAAMTNSDKGHGEQVERQLGYRLDDWLCAEEARVYKPDPGFWRAMARRRGVAPGPRWWHVSAYADYDLRVAESLGLTTVFVARPHARPDASRHVVADLHGLVVLLSNAAPRAQVPG
jgi:2-haloacid dehalogenase